MKKITKTVFAAAIIVLMASSAIAKGPGGMGRGHGPGDGKHRLMRMTERLDLSVEQQTQIEQLLAEMKKEMESLWIKKDKVRDQINKLWLAESVNEQALMAAIEKSMRIKTKMRKLRAEYHIDVLELLTPEQKEQFRAHKKERFERRGKRGPRGGRGKPPWGAEGRGPGRGAGF